MTIKKSWLLVTLWVMLMTACPAYAEGSQTLRLLSVTPADTSVNVAVDTVITLEFNGNVVSEGLRNINRNAITLWQDDSRVEVDVEMADENQAPDERGQIIVRPREALREGKTYTVKVDTTLTAKDGSVMTTAVRSEFTTLAPEKAPFNPVYLGAALVAVLIVSLGIFILMKKNKG